MAVPVIALAMLAAQIGGSIYSAVKSKRENEAKQNAANAKDRIADDLYRQQISDAETLKQTEGDFLNTASGKGLVTQLNDRYDDALRDATASGLKGGQTEEAKTAQTQAINESYTDSLNRIGQLSTNHRLGILSQANSLRDRARVSRANAATNLQNDLIGLAEERNQSALNLGQNINQAAGNISSYGGWVGNDSDGNKVDFWGLSRKANEKENQF